MLAPTSPFPAAPAPALSLQAAPSAAAGEFEGLLARLTGSGEPASTAAGETIEADTPAEAPVTGFLAAPPLPAAVPVAAPGGSGESQPSQADPASAGLQSEAPAPGEPAPDASLPEASAQASSAERAPAAATEETDVPQTRADAGSQEAAPDAEPAPAAAARTAPVLPHEPPQLRPLAERTSQPLDPSVQSSAGDPPQDSASTSPQPASSRPEQSQAVDRPNVQTAPPAADAAAVAPEVEEAPGSAGPAQGERTSSAETAASPQNAALSMTSRGAVEATAQIAAQILRRLDGRATRFEIALLPEELGRVDVKLDIDSEGRLAARLAFDNPAAAADLRGRADELRRQLEQAGFHLAEDAFEFAERDSGSSAFDRGEDARQGSQRAFAAARRLHLQADAAPAVAGPALSLSPSGVDLKV